MPSFLMTTAHPAPSPATLPHRIPEHKSPPGRRRSRPRRPPTAQRRAERSGPALAPGDVSAAAPASSDLSPPVKNRRDVLGGARGQGHKLPGKVRRRSAAAIRLAQPDPSLTSVAGLVAFGAFLDRSGVDEQLATTFGRLKRGRLVVYPMPTQMRLLIDTLAVGEERVFALEALAHDALFTHLGIFSISRGEVGGGPAWRGYRDGAGPTGGGAG